MTLGSSELVNIAKESGMLDLPPEESWLRPNVNYSFMEWLYMKFVKFGEVPNHVAIIMDGNRRYARERNLQTVNGHQSGFKKLSEVLAWCYDLKIKELSVYAFSNANFSRSEEEVNYLMDLAYDKFKQLHDNIAKVNEHNVCVRVIGDLARLPKKLSSVLAKVMLATQENTGSILNIFMAYTSTDEIVDGLNNALSNCKLGNKSSTTINDENFSNSIQSFEISPIDLLIRTSGETRLSDFLTWQVSKDEAVYEFIDKKWPEFSVFDFCYCVLQYQLSTLHAARITQRKSIASSTDSFIKKRQRDLRGFAEVSN